MVGFSGVVVPTIAPSLTVQKSFPSQPSSEVPLKIGVKPASASAATPLPEKERAARNPATRSHPPVKRAARTGHLRMGSTEAPSVRRPVTPGEQYATFASTGHAGPGTGDSGPQGDALSGGSDRGHGRGELVFVDMEIGPTRPQITRGSILQAPAHEAAVLEPRRLR